MLSEREIKRLEDKALSDTEVLKICGNSANFIAYDRLRYVKHIDEILSPYGSCILLYLAQPNYGHFIALNLVGPKQDKLEAFDSYGYMPDDELTEMSIDPSMRSRLGENFTYLAKLMYESGYKLSYNHHKLQAKKEDIKTCGRWAGIRTLLKHLSLEDFVDLFKNNKYGTPDEIVTIISNIIADV